MTIGKIILAVALIAISCSKKNGSGDYCWRCEISGGSPYQSRTLDTCTQNDNPRFGFSDANGNDLNYFCRPK